MDLITAQKQGFVIGLKNQSGTQPRREIDDFMVNDPDCFNLYILALEQLTRDGGNATDKMGYFQIAGIHGLPLSDWDGIHVPARTNDRGQTIDTVGSYCTHASYLFPSWHRPYLAMMEQTIYSTVLSIAGKFQDTKYQAAAKRFRLPYWDWIKPRAHKATSFPGVRDPNRRTSFPYNYDLPLVCQVPELNVFIPGNEKILSVIRNPLRWYDFPQNGSVPKQQWDQLDSLDNQRGNTVHPNRMRTVRDPATTTSPDDYQSVNDTLNMVRQATVVQALDLLSKPYDAYLDFAAERPRWVFDANKTLMLDDSGNPLVKGPHGSLEDIHNGYHVYVGGNGHMGRVPVAAFDPVFWLHHCNIDRILSVWQACHSGTNSWLPPDDPVFGQNVPLWPFRAGPGKNDMWTSAMVRTITAFGYTYTDIQSNSADTLRMWSENYDWSDLRNFRPARLPQPPTRMAPVDVTMAQVFQAPSTTTNPFLANFALSQQAHVMTEPIMAARMAPHPDEIVPQAQRLLKSVVKPDAEPVVQWYVDVQVQRDAFNGAFTIYFFIGSAELMREADQHPERYSTAPTMAGLTHVFTAPREACDACNIASEQGVVVTGTNPVTPMLRDYVFNGTIAGLAEEQVIPFLKKSLYWRVVATNNVPKDTTQVPGLKVTVSSTVEVRQPGAGAPSSWEPHDHPEVTEGRNSGNPVGVSL